VGAASVALALVGDLAYLAGSVTYWCMGCKKDVDRIVTIRPGAYRKPPKLLCEECAKKWKERNHK
jgi:DNA-directed RNA polymerase subunit RPC12/RpoP